MARGHRDAAILESLIAAFDGLARERNAEGAKLSALLGGHVLEIARLTGEAGRLAAAQPQALKDKLAEQLRECSARYRWPRSGWRRKWRCSRSRPMCARNWTGLPPIAQDARELIATGRGVGRKLDFLAQEFNREANTLCSKSSDIALTRVGLALKAAIDQFREQAQNVE